MNQYLRYSLLLAAIGMGCTSSIRSAPEHVLYQAGQAVSTNLLLRLTDPQYNPAYHIGIVNTAAATGMLVTAMEVPKAVQILRGSENFLWVDAAKQIELAGNDGQLSFEISRTTITESTCTRLTSALENFATELEKTLSVPIGLSAEAPAAINGSREEIAIDGTSFIIQVMTNGTKFAITPDRSRNSSLDNAAMSLHSTVSGCSNTVARRIEQHYFH